MPQKSPPLSTEKKLEKSLSSAAKILNKKIHIPDKFRAEAALSPNVNVHVVQLYQVYCTDEEKVISSPTTDHDAAERIRDEHNDSTGHISKIVVSQ